MSQKWSVRWGTCVVALTILGSVIASHGKAFSAGLLVADGGFGGKLEIKQQDVRVTINNSIAVTQIDQVFVNTENRQVEALYTFPVPREASVSNFSMWISGKEMIGEVVEKQRAREIYDSYKRQKRDPGLLEQVDFKSFEMRIFPIPAGAEQRVRIEYYQQLDIDHDWATYVYPLATVGNGQPIDSKVHGRFSMNVDIKSEVPIAEMRSESHQDEFVVASHQANYAQAAMELTEGDLSRDVVMAVQLKRPRTGLDVVTSRPPGEDGYFMMTLTPGEDLQASDQPMDYVFLLDISGSMARDAKMELSRRSVAAFIDLLSPQDRFECLAFNLQPTPLFRSLVDVEQGQLDRAGEFFAKQRARGGTVLQPAIEAAYQYRDDDRPLNVVLLSDGMTEAGEQAELLRLIQSRPSGVRVFCIGVGNEVNRPLLTQMAEQAGGLAAFVSTEDSFARQAKLMRQKLVRPAIENVSVMFDGSEVVNVEPEQLGDLFYGTPLRLFGRYKSPAVVPVTIRGTIEGAPWEQSIDFALPDDDEGNSEIERMWANGRVHRLLADERSQATNHRDEIIRLSEAYSIVSPYASMLVLENDAEYKRWKIDQRNAVRIQRDRISRESLAKRLAGLRRGSNTGDKANGERLVSKPQSKSPSSMRESSLPSPAPANPSTQPGRGFDLNVGGSGGGAIEPFTATIALGCVGAAMAARRRKRHLGRATD